MLTLDAGGLPHTQGRLLKLPPKERAALRLLWLRRPEVVRKDEFAESAWDRQWMSDESLARCISRLRRTLQPLGLRVEAWYGLGYRLLEQDFPETEATRFSANGGHALAHARHLLQLRTPAAVGLAIDRLRGLVRDVPTLAAARVALAEALSVAIGWGQVSTQAAVEEGLATLTRAEGRDEPGHHAARGSLLDFSWRFTEARACFELALTRDGDRPDTLLAFARHLLYVDAAAEAVAVLRRVHRLVPHALHPRTLLARALLQSGQGAEAMAEVEATLTDHPGHLVLTAFSLSMQALVAPRPELESVVMRLMRGLDTPPVAWATAAFVLSRLGRREAALDIVDSVLSSQATTAGEATLLAAPLAALGEFERAADLLRRAADDRCGMLAMVLRDPAHAGWLPQHPAGQQLLRSVFGG